jgi:hypothetical protein
MNAASCRYSPDLQSTTCREAANHSIHGLQLSAGWHDQPIDLRRAIGQNNRRAGRSTDSSHTTPRAFSQRQVALAERPMRDALNSLAR